MATRPIELQKLESRQLFSFATLDPAFAGDGIALVPGASVNPGDGAIYGLADGGAIIRMTDRTFRRYDASGAAISTYGNSDGTADGTLTNAGSYRAKLSTVDPRTARLATLSPVGSNISSKLIFYSAAGKRERSVDGITVGGLDLSKIVAMNFDSEGRLVVMLRTFTSQGWHEQVARILPTSGKLDSTFGTGGVIQLQTIQNSNGPFLAIGPDDSVTVARQTDSMKKHVRTYLLQIERFDRRGQRIDKFGNAGIVQLSYGTIASIGGPYGTTRNLTDMAIAGDGAVLLFERINSVDPSRYATSGFEVRRVRTSGKLAERVDLSERFRIHLGEPKQMHVGSDGDIWLTSTSQIVRLNSDLTPDDLYNGPESSADFVNMQNGAAVELIGDRVWVAGIPATLAGGYEPQLRVFRGSTPGLVRPSTATAAAVKLADGTLDVTGTSRNDTVRLRIFPASLEVTVNSVVQAFAPAEVRALVVHTGNGDDTITFESAGAAWSLEIRAQGGKGNDRLTADGVCYFEGGDGNDRLQGSNGSDVLNGGLGNDTLHGAVGFDKLIGGFGDDVLLASDDQGTDDSSINTLIGGAGADRFVRSVHSAGSTGFLYLDVLKDVGEGDILG